MNNKLGLIILAIVFMASAASAQPWISDVSVNPSNPDVGEEVEVTAVAEDSGRIMYMQANFGDGWTSYNCDTLYTCDNEDDPWTYTPEDSGSHEVEVRAVDQNLEYSDIETGTFQASEERERYAEFVDFPSNWVEGETQTVKAEAFDSEGKLYDQDFRIRVRERYSSFWSSWETVATDDCYVDPRFGVSELKNCDVEGEFEPDSDRRHQMEAFIRTSDDDYRLYDREYFTPESDDPETHRLSVTVRDDSGNRLNNAEVEVDGETKDTNSLGRVSFYLENGNYEVDASKEGYVSDSKDIEIDDADQSVEFNLEQEDAETHALTVTVRDESGNRLNDADVTVDGETKDTNSLGRVRFYLENGDYEVEASKNGYSTNTQDVEINNADESIGIELESTGLELSLRRPLNGASIDIPYTFRWRSSNTGEDPVHTVYIKRDGRSGSLWDSRNEEEYVGEDTSYRLTRSLRPGRYDWGVEAEADGNTIRRRASFTIEDEDELVDLDAEFDFRPSNPEVGETVEFDASDSEGDIDDYRWSFGDGTSASGREVSHSYSSSGWYTVRLTVEGEAGQDSTTRSVYVSDEDVEGRLEVTTRDDENSRLRGARVTAMALTPSDFVARSTDKDDYSRSSSSSRVGDYELGFELDDDDLETYVEYHSGYSRHAWNNLALESSDGDHLVFRYDLAADTRQGRFREYGASQQVDLSSGEKEVTVILTLNGDKLDSFTSRIDVPDDHEFSKVRDSGRTTYNGRDTRTGNTPSLPIYTRYTDNRGKTSFDIPEGRYMVTGTKTGYTSDRENVDVERDETESVDLRLDRLGDRIDDPRDPSDPDDPDSDRERVEITSISLPASVCRGDDLNARITVENTGNKDLDFAIAASGLSSDITRIYYLDEGEKDTKVITFPYVQGSGNQQISFTTGYDSEERVVQVRDCGFNEDTGLSVSVTPTELQIGESVRVSGILEGSGRREVDISVGGVHKQSVSTEPNGRFNAYVSPSRTGAQDVTVESQGITRTRRINVLPTVNVHSVSVPDRPFEGESFNICGDIESQTAPLVILRKDGEVVESKNGKGSVCFERTERTGNYRYEIQAFNRGVSDSASNTVEVLESDVEARSFPDQIASVQSGSGMARVEIYNNRDGVRNYAVELEGLPDTWTSQSRKEVVLDKGERRTVYIYFTPKLEGDFEASLKVSSEGEQIHSENINISSGGTDRGESLWQRIMLWFRYG